MLRIVKLLKHQSKIYTDIIGYIRRKTWKYYSEYYRKCEINSKWSRETISLTPHAHCLSAEKDWWFKLPTVFRTIEMIATKTLKHLGKPKMLLNGKGYLPSAVMYQKRTRLITINISTIFSGCISRHPCCCFYGPFSSQTSSCPHSEPRFLFCVCSYWYKQMCTFSCNFLVVQISPKVSLEISTKL